MNSADQTQEIGQRVVDMNLSQASSAANNASKTDAFCSNHDQQVGLQFDSTVELDAAIDWLWTEPQLRDLPRVHVGRNTMIVPTGSVDLFRSRGYQFTLSRVVSAGELLPEDINRIRRDATHQAV